jgi:hypothetical protein
VPWTRETAVLALAIVSLLLGLFPWPAYFPASTQALSSPPTFATLASALWPIVAGGVIAIALGRGTLHFAGMPGVVAAALDRTRRAARIAAGGFMRLDSALRQWPAAVVAVLVLATLFAITIAAGGRGF